MDLRCADGLKEFLKWHQHIVTWGLGVYVSSYVKDLENTMGAPRRQSLEKMIYSEKEVTEPEIGQAETGHGGIEQVGERPLPRPRNPTNMNQSHIVTLHEHRSASLEENSMFYSQLFE